MHVHQRIHMPSRLSPPYCSLSLLQTLFISDAMESFSPPSCTSDPSGEDAAALADDQASPEATPPASPGNSGVTPTSYESSFASRRRRSSLAPSPPSGNNGIGGGATGRVAPEPRLSKLASSTARSSTATGLEPQNCPKDPGDDFETGGGYEGGRRGGDAGGKASPARRRSATPPPNVDTSGQRSPANVSKSIVEFARCGTTFQFRIQSSIRLSYHVCPAQD